MAKNGLLIDYEFCTGCRTCEIACRKAHPDIPIDQFGLKVAEIGPWEISKDNWQWHYIPVPTRQCDLCGERVAKGKAPTCVKHCQSFVIQYGDVEELAKEMTKKPEMVLFSPK